MKNEDIELLTEEPTKEEKAITKKYKLARKKIKLKKNSKILLISLIVILVVTIGKYWIDIIDKYQENERLTKELATLKEKELELKIDVEKLQDPEYLERYAREKYLYSKDGELIIRFPDEEESDN